MSFKKYMNILEKYNLLSEHVFFHMKGPGEKPFCHLLVEFEMKSIWQLFEALTKKKNQRENHNRKTRQRIPQDTGKESSESLLQNPFHPGYLPLQDVFLYTIPLSLQELMHKKESCKTERSGRGINYCWRRRYALVNILCCPLPFSSVPNPIIILYKCLLEEVDLLVLPLPWV